MPWYKIFAHHGGGHMGHTELFRWYENPLSKEEQKEVWDDEFDDERRYSNPSGGISRIKSIPSDVLAEKFTYNANIIAVAERQVADAKLEYAKMQKVLKTTKPGPCSHSSYASLDFPKYSDLGIMPPVGKCRHCGKIRVYGHKWINPPKNLRRFAKKYSFQPTWWKQQQIEEAMAKKA